MTILDAIGGLQVPNVGWLYGRRTGEHLNRSFCQLSSGEDLPRRQNVGVVHPAPADF